MSIVSALGVALLRAQTNAILGDEFMLRGEDAFPADESYPEH